MINENIGEVYLIEDKHNKVSLRWEFNDKRKTIPLNEIQLKNIQSILNKKYPLNNKVNND